MTMQLATEALVAAKLSRSLERPQCRAGPVSHLVAGNEAVEYARAFRNVVDLSAVEIHSTRRQVLRYESFFARINPDFEATVDLARKLADEIPEYLERIESWGYAHVRARQLAHNRQEMCVTATRRRSARRER